MNKWLAAIVIILILLFVWKRKKAKPINNTTGNPRTGAPAVAGSAGAGAAIATNGGLQVAPTPDGLADHVNIQSAADVLGTQFEDQLGMALVGQ